MKRIEIGRIGKTSKEIKRINKEKVNIKKYKYIILIVLALVIAFVIIKIFDKASDTAAEEKTITVKDEEIKSPQIKTKEEEIIEEFKTVTLGEFSDIIKYIDKNIVKLDAKSSDDLILEFLDEQRKRLAEYQDKLFETEVQEKLGQVFGNSFDISKIDDIEDKDIKKLLEEIISSGYNIKVLDDSFYAIIDYSTVEKYDIYTSKRLNEYIDIMNIENKDTVSNNETLMIGYAELGERIMKAEKYLLLYSTETINIEIFSLYMKYMKIYIIGSENTKHYNLITKKYDDEYIKSCIIFLNNYEKTISGQVLKPFLEILRNDQYVKTDKVSLMSKDFTEILNASNDIEELEQNIPNFEGVEPLFIFSSLLPSQAGYKWAYKGFAEYRHEMTLMEIERKGNKKIYTVIGKVLDMSNGEGGNDKDYFNIDIKYTVSAEGIIQEKEENVMMSSFFDKLTIIRPPLVAGNRWENTYIDKDGNEIDIISHITRVEEIDGKMHYTVEYRGRNSYHFEERKIMEGKGIVGYTKIYKPKEGNTIFVGYNLYEK